MELGPKAFWLMLLLLLPSAALDCSEEYRSLQLSRSQILATWQPDGAGCRWWENRTTSEMDQFPAAVRSGPRWLVMQLRQPMMLEAVSVRGWDGQWQAAAPVGSPLSAVGASSLPLELQLEDPCRASWEAFSISDRWRQLGGAAESAIRYILVNSPTSSLSWSHINATVRNAPLNLIMLNNWHCPIRDLSAMREGSTACFLVSSCGHESIRCFFNLTNGSLRAPIQLNQLQPAEFYFDASFALHGATLACHLRDRPAARIEQTVGIAAVPANVYMSVTPVWVSGRSITVTVMSSPAYPEQRHNCSIISGSTEWIPEKNYTEIETAVSRTRNNQTALSVTTRLRFEVSAAMLHGTLMCSSKHANHAASVQNTAVQHQRMNQLISAISEPCQTAVYLGSSRHWLVGEIRRISVTSSRCSIWNVSHRCRLLLDDRARHQPLHKVQQGSFKSTHELLVVEAMTRSAWRILCSVHQSGLDQGDSESDSNSSPAVFGEGDKSTIEIEFGTFNVGQLDVRTVVRRPSTRLPVSNISCSAEGRDIKYLDGSSSSAYHVVRQLIWSELSVNGCCTAYQNYDGKAVFELQNCTQFHFQHRQADSPHTRDCDSGKSYKVLYITAAASAQIVIIFVVAMATWWIATSQRPTARPQTAQQGGGFEGLQAIPLQKVIAARAAAETGETAPFAIPTSDSGMAEDSVYEQICQLVPAAHDW